jgi:LacI family transcriptional regulator
MLLGGMLKCAEHGYRMIFELVDTHDDHVERELAAAIAALQPDGIILTPPHSDNPRIVDFLGDQNIPFVRIGSREAGPGIALTMDDTRMAGLATRHLIEHGHERIGFIAGSPEYRLSARRVAGWRTAMDEAGLPTGGLLAGGDFSYASGERAAAALLDASRPPTAIIASNDQMALATLEAARARGIAVPGGLSLVSFDNTPLVHFTQPPLTAVDQPIAETVSCAVDLIIRAQKGEDLPDGVTTVQGSLAERASVAPPA